MTKPTSRALDLVLKLLAPWRAATSPVLLGLDRVPEERPLLFVGNHTLYGILDSPIMFAELYEKKGIVLRALGDHAHWKVPVWGEVLSSLGVVDGTRENCDRLMKDGEAILVFPGGAREVAKRKGEKYRLIWKERLGFARLAIAHGCTIVPFAAVGAEEALDIVLDADQIMASPLGALLKKLDVKPDRIPPVVKGLGLTPLPRPERLYFSFAEPIATASYGGRSEDDAASRELRDRVRAAVEAEIARLLDERGRDRERGFLSRLAQKLKRPHRS